jgi:hypothetical protein
MFPMPGHNCCHVIRCNARYVFWPLRRYAERRSKPDAPRFLYRIRERLRAETSVCLLCERPTREHPHNGCRYEQLD